MVLNLCRYLSEKVKIIQVDITSFIDSLDDPRRSQGIRHQFDHLIIMILMAILSGHQGVRGFHRFAKSNKEELIDIFKPKHGIPGFSTFQSLMSSLDEQVLEKQFIAWVKKNLAEAADDYIGLDGKAILSSSSGGHTKDQNFASLVNAFGHRSGVVYGMKAFENGKSGEGQALRDLLELLGLEGKTFTMDALHAQKKR